MSSHADRVVGLDEVGASKDAPILSRWHWRILLGLLLIFGVLSYLAISSGSPSEMRERSVVLTTFGTITGPFVGAIARNGQSCCLEASIQIACVAGPILALGLLAQVFPLPRTRAALAGRLLLWTTGWLAWLTGGLLSFAHALS